MQLHFTNPMSETAIGLLVLAALLLVAIIIVTMVSGKVYDWVINNHK